ncbi:hypothetical protein LTS14_005507 [Recurvomyces mirabilis]|uniref:uncharacterized protein n=1 Tax=Recurvomyces mirabilis TaxID=574656 RepID=UPI002DDEA0BC|nr:hypothetical protein LTS14_005507 [Recurvomyces mirabilis]
MVKRRGRASNQNNTSIPDLPPTGGDWTQFLVPPREFSQKQWRSGVGLDNLSLESFVNVNARSNSVPCATSIESIAASPSASVHDSKLSSTQSVSSDVSGTEDLPRQHELVKKCTQADAARAPAAQLRANSTPVFTDQIDIAKLHRLFTKARARCLRDVCVHALLRRSVGCQAGKVRQGSSAVAGQDDELDAAEEGQYFLPAGLLDDEEEEAVAGHSQAALRLESQKLTTASRPSAFLEYDFRPHVSTRDTQCRSGAEVWSRDTDTKAFLDSLRQAKYCWHTFMTTDPELAIQYLRTPEHLHLWQMISEINENLAPHELSLPLPQWPTQYLVDLTNDVKAVHHAMTRREVRVLRQRLASHSNGVVVGGLKGKEVWDLLVAAASSCVRDARLGLEDLVVLRDAVVSGLWMGIVGRCYGDGGCEWAGVR